jgi:hypothetical protein
MRNTNSGLVICLAPNCVASLGSSPILNYSIYLILEELLFSPDDLFPVWSTRSYRLPVGGDASLLLPPCMLSRSPIDSTGADWSLMLPFQAVLHLFFVDGLARGLEASLSRRTRVLVIVAPFSRHASNVTAMLVHFYRCSVRPFRHCR